MSRIGKMPITLPANVTVEVSETNNVTVSGPLGKLHLDVDKNITIQHEGNELVITRHSDEKQFRAKHGLYRALIANMVKGVSEGFKKVLTVKGVGYRLTKKGKTLVMNIGYSKPAEVTEAEGITLTAVDNDKIIVSGIDKELVGQFAAKIKALKPVEPYHLYGIKYENEFVARKEGKKAGKK